MNKKRYIVKLIDDYNETTNLCEVYVPENITESEIFSKFAMGQNYVRCIPDCQLNPAHFDEHMDKMQAYRQTHNDETVFIYYMRLCGYDANIINPNYTIDW